MQNNLYPRANTLAIGQIADVSLNEREVAPLLFSNSGFDIVGSEPETRYARMARAWYAFRPSDGNAAPRLARFPPGGNRKGGT